MNSDEFSAGAERVGGYIHNYPPFDYSQNLEISHVSARWIPKLLSEEQKGDVVKFSKELLSMYKADKGFLNCINTGDESCFHYYEPETNSQSKQWKRRDEPAPIRVKAAPSAGKRMATVIWDREGILLLDWLPEKTTINSDYYLEH